MIVTIFDVRDAAKFYSNGNSAIALVYGLKAAGNTSLSTAARVVGARAAAVIGPHISIMSTGAWLTVLVFGIQIFIWVMSDDALKERFSLCAFGINRDSRDAYRTFKAQIEQLEKARSEIGLQEEKS